MDRKKTIFSDAARDFLRNTIVVFINNVFSLLSGVIVSLGLPKILSMEAYSDYKLFMLYLSYIGLFHFGLIDGTVIKFAGKKESEASLTKYRFVTRLLACMEIAAAGLILAVVFGIFDREYRFLGSMAALDIVVHNMLTYYRSVLQISMRYNAYTATGVYGNIYRLASVLILLYLSKFGMAVCNVYILIYMVGELSQLFICILLCKNITFGKRDCFRDVKGDIKDLFSQGISLLMAGIAATLLLNMDRQFVAAFFSKTDYAVYSFSYSLINMILTLISAMSVVLYPTMKEKKKEWLGIYYDKFTYFLTFFVFGCFIFLPVLLFFIQWFLPDYIQAWDIFRIITPIVVYLALMQIVIINFYKVIENTKTYLMISAAAVALSFCFNLIAYTVFKSMEAIAAATVLSSYLWFFVSDRVIRKKIVSNKSVVCDALLMTLAYYFSYTFVWVKNPYAGAVSYVVLYLIFGRKFLRMKKDN